MLSASYETLRLCGLGCALERKCHRSSTQNSAIKLVLICSALERRPILTIQTAQEPFETAIFLATVGTGRSVVRRKIKENFFSQGGPADAVFYLQSGRAKLSV